MDQTPEYCVFPTCPVLAELRQTVRTMHDDASALQADLDRYMAMVSPANAIALGEFLGPTKPCPFCGSVALERDGFEEYIICKNCGASAPVSGWQFRAPINRV